MAKTISEAFKVHNEARLSSQLDSLMETQLNASFGDASDGTYGGSFGDFNSDQWGFPPKTSLPYFKTVPPTPPGDQIDPEAIRRIIDAAAKDSANRSTQEMLEWQDKYNRSIAEQEALKTQLAALQKEIERLNKENKSLRLRAGAGRTVEDEPEGS